jgi:hypothetical protein
MRGTGITRDDEAKRLLMRKLKSVSRKERSQEKKSFHVPQGDSPALNER